jgi:adenylate kinase family enzyme
MELLSFNLNLPALKYLEIYGREIEIGEYWHEIHRKWPNISLKKSDGSTEKFQKFLIDPKVNLNDLKKIHLNYLDLHRVIPTGERLNQLLSIFPNISVLYLNSTTNFIPRNLNLILKKLAWLYFYGPYFAHKRQEIINFFSCYQMPKLDLIYVQNEDMRKFLSSEFPNIRVGNIHHRKTSSEQTSYGHELGISWNSSYQPQTLDTRTNHAPSITVRELFKPKANDKPNTRDYRLHVSTDINLTEIVRLSDQPFSIVPIKIYHENKNIKSIYLKKYEQAETIFYGQIEIPVQQQNDWFALPSLTTEDKLVDLSANQPIELGHCKEKALFYVKSSSPGQKPITISFMIHADKKKLSLPDVVPLPFHLIRFSKDGTLIPDASYLKVLEQFNALKSLEKIACLKNFCKFTSKDVTSSSEHGIDKLNALIQNQAGACRHATWVFMALAKALGVQARAVENDCHAFVECAFEGFWYEIDLGGGPVTSINKIPMKENPIEEIKALKPTKSDKKPQADKKPQKILTLEDSSPHDLSTDPTDISEKKPRKQEISNNPFNTWDTIKSNATHFDAYCQEIMDATCGLSEGKRNLLVILNEDQIESFHFHVTQFLNANHKKFYYLHTFDNLSEKQAAVTPEGLLNKLDSSLIQLIQQASDGDMLITNWSDYKSTFVGYNTLMDSERKLKSHKVSPKLTNLVLLDREKVKTMGEDFYSRIRATSSCLDFSGPEPLKQRLSQNTDIEKHKIVHFYDEEWKVPLLGKVGIERKGFILKKGFLLKALEKNKSGLVLENAPWEDVEFRLFMTELMNTRKFTFNGKTIALPESFSFSAREIPYEFDTNKVTGKAFDQKNCRILNSETFKFLLRNKKCSNDLIHSSLGWIKEHENQILNLLVTETLPAKSWARLIKLAKSKNCVLNLQLAPKVILPEGLASQLENAKEQLSDSNQTKLVVTNDLDLAEEEYLAFHPSATVISIQADTQFSDLIQKIHKLGNNEDLTSGYVSKMGYVGSALLELKDKTIILKGQLSPMLARQLETLFLNPPFLWVNGEQQFSLGKLIILSDQKNCLSFVKEVKKNYTEADYWDRLNQQFSDKPKYKQFTQSYAELKDKEPNLQFSYGQLRTMANKVTKGHLANPFKPYFRLDSKQTILSSAKSIWKKPAKVKIDDILKRRHAKIVSELALSNYLFIVGSSGVGKSTYVKKLKKDGIPVYGIEEIKEWLKNKDDIDKILFIDEANLATEGIWDFLEGLFNQTPGILIDGDWYPLSPHHKVIFTGNGTHFAGRQEHQFIKDHGQVIQFKEMSDQDLSSVIIEPALKTNFPRINYRELQQSSQLILKAYNHINTLPNHPFTLRNLKAICLKTNITDSQDLMLALKLAILDEADLFLDEDQKNRLMALLEIDKKYVQNREKERYENLPDRIGDILIPPSRKKLLARLQQQLSIREKVLTNPALSEFEIPSLIIEGLPGIGKSRLAIELLKAQGYRLGHLNDNDKLDTTKKYYHLTPTDPDFMKATLIQAYNEGAMVIIDELNSSPIEEIINKLYDGTEDQEHKATKGFSLIVTQNPISFSGREILSKALTNRLPIFLLDDYPEQELREMTSCICNDVELANQIVDEYIDAKLYAKLHHKTPEPTPRNLFEYLAVQGYRLTPEINLKIFKNCSLPLDPADVTRDVDNTMNSQQVDEHKDHSSLPHSKPLDPWDKRDKLRAVDNRMNSQQVKEHKDDTSLRTSHSFVLEIGASLAAFAGATAGTVALLGLLGVISLSSIGIGLVLGAGFFFVGLELFGFYEAREQTSMYHPVKVNSLIA